MIIKNLTFSDLRYANVQRQKEWDPEGKINGAFRGLEFSEEIGELLEKLLLMVQLGIQSGLIDNAIKKRERERLGLKGSQATVFEIAQEFADALITLDLLAMHYSIDLGAATRLKFNLVSEKMNFKTRLP